MKTFFMLVALAATLHFSSNIGAFDSKAISGGDPTPPTCDGFAISLPCIDFPITPDLCGRIYSAYVPFNLSGAGARTVTTNYITVDLCSYKVCDQSFDAPPRGGCRQD